MSRAARSAAAPSGTPVWLAGQAALLVLAMGLAGCGEDNHADPGTAAQPASAGARVKFKGPHRLASDLAQALALPRQELCRELSTYDCLATHNIVLGGVEPYKLRIDEPLPVAPVSGPLALDRIALTTCGERAARDFAAPEQAELFIEIAASATARPDTAALTAVSQRLYERLLGRAAETAEIEALVAFADELDTSATPGRDFAQLACYAVATTNEFLFY